MRQCVHEIRNDSERIVPSQKEIVGHGGHGNESTGNEARSAAARMVIENRGMPLQRHVGRPIWIERNAEYGNWRVDS